MSSNGYVLGLHEFLLGQSVRFTQNPDGDGTDHIISLWYTYTGDYANGDEKVIVDSNRRIIEMTVHVSRGDIMIWKSQKITNFKTITYRGVVGLTPLVKGEGTKRLGIEKVKPVFQGLMSKFNDLFPS